ncbi:MAG: 3-oxoacyl-ACP synthase III [Actinobacteria bacterium]|nr:3-oxoacyl-ACP synthase III [Actinomycetota bacterium]MCB9413618.1 3-oxoacyl-ACP synthase III [Actinomycetota bacterium]
MSGNSIYRSHNAAVLSVAAVDAPEDVPSSYLDEQLAETLDRLGLRPGMLENVAGIKTRQWWPEGFSYTDAAAEAGRLALAEAGISPDRIGLLVDTSVSRARLEPSSAVSVHHELGLPTSCLNFDLSNACLGFVNAMQLAAMMIDAGQIEYALIVDGEGSRDLQLRTLQRLKAPEATIADVMSDFASFTLGSGGAGMVMGPADRHPDGHRFVGGIGRAATEHNQLCQGDMNRMVTDSRGLLLAGLDVAEIAMKEARLEFDWDDIDHYIIHQVSTVHCDAMVQRLGLDPAKVPLTFPDRGNIGPAAIPITLALHQENIARGDRVMLMGMGSGINAAAYELVW